MTDSREAFEAWVAATYSDGGSDDAMDQLQWAAWQAATSRMQAEIRALQEDLLRREAQVSVLVALMPQFKPKYGAVGSQDTEVGDQIAAWEIAVKAAQPGQALAIHDEQVARAAKVEALREAAEIAGAEYVRERDMEAAHYQLSPEPFVMTRFGFNPANVRQAKSIYEQLQALASAIEQGENRNEQP